MKKMFIAAMLTAGLFQSLELSAQKTPKAQKSGLAAQYESFKIVHERFAIAKKNQKFGVLDTNGQVLLPFEYDRIQTATNPYSKTEGEPETPTQFLVVKKNKKFGVLNFHNLSKQTAPDLVYDKYQDVYLSISGNYILAKKNGKWGCLNEDLATLIPFEQDSIYIGDIGDTEIFCVQKNGKWAMFQVSEKLEYVYDSLFMDADKGKGAYLKNGKWGVIDWSNGFKEIDTKYVNIRPSGWDFIAQAQKNGKWALLDNYGNAVSDFEYDMVIVPQTSAPFYLQNQYLLSKNGRIGIYDSKTKKIQPLKKGK